MLQDTETLTGNLIDCPARCFGLGAEIVPGREDDGINAGEAGQVAAPAVEIARMREHDEQSSWPLPFAGAPGEHGCCQRRRRTPSAIHHGAAAVAQGRHHCRKTLHPRQHLGQILQTLGHNRQHFWRHEYNLLPSHYNCILSFFSSSAVGSAPADCAAYPCLAESPCWRFLIAFSLLLR